ncbi:hypothetical protein FEP51_00429 [Burkholderia multivorans]|nr:hypothetical protein [Burkholderia multivorans]
MSPRVHAAATSGGRRLTIFTSFGLTPAACSATSVWKCDVDTNGTPIFLPLSAAMLVTPEPLRATSASASLMLSSTQNSEMSSPCDKPAAIGLEPASPSCTEPDASARITSAPLSSLRNVTL